MRRTASSPLTLTPTLLLVLLSLTQVFWEPVQSFGTLCGSRETRKLMEEERMTLSSHGGPTGGIEPNTKIAFLGDVGNKDTSRETLKLAKEFGAGLVVIGGDFDYEDDPAAWDDLLDEILGDEIHVLAAMGNHDMLSWSPAAPKDQGKGYGVRLGKRMSKTGIDKQCVGLDADHLGVKTACNYRGVQILLSAVGTWGQDHDLWMEEVFSSTEAIWRVCDFHKVQHAYQIGLKLDETGWGVYQTCLRHGAILATHHEHSYARTKNMADFKDKQIANEDSLLTVRPGQSFAFVSGLGGYQVRPYYGGEQNPWWAQTAARQDEIRAAVLLCEFHIDSDPRKAHCDYVGRDRKRWDAFDIRSENPLTSDHDFPKHPTPAGAEKEEECESPFLELPVLRGEDDFTFRPIQLQEAMDISTAAEAFTAAMEVLDTADAELRITPGESVFLRFPGMEYRMDRWTDLRESGLDAAHLQLKGLQGDGYTEIEIRIGSVDPETGHLTALSTAAVLWDLLEDEEDWEEDEVWVSPDLSGLLRELPSLHGGLAVILDLKQHGRDGDALGMRSFYSHDATECFAPHLTLHFSPELSGVCHRSVKI